jgi:hypothetical protein
MGPFAKQSSSTFSSHADPIKLAILTAAVFLLGSSLWLLSQPRGNKWGSVLMSAAFLVSPLPFLFAYMSASTSTGYGIFSNQISSGLMIYVLALTLAAAIGLPFAITTYVLTRRTTLDRG